MPTLIVKGIPAEVCDQCGETYLDSTTTAKLLDLARAAAPASLRTLPAAFPVG